MNSISEPVKRFDFDDKVSGKARYCADLQYENMLYARTLRSDRPRARITGIIYPSLPDGYFIVDKTDLPGPNSVPIVYDDQPYLARDEVNYIGEPILLVVGPDKTIVLDIIKNIEVAYEDIPAILSLEEAIRAEKPPIFRGQPYFVEYQYSHGDVDQAIMASTQSVCDDFFTGYQEQAYLEPQAMLAQYTDGKITVWGSMQCPYYIHEALMQALNFPKEKVRVVQLPTGGGFGGKEEYPSIIAVHAALAAIKSGCPVQLVLERGEDILCTTKRHPAHIKITSYLDREQRILAREVDIYTDAGAYAGLSSVVLQRLMFACCGVYQLDHLRVRGWAMATNKVVSGAFRGFGGPQAMFAAEMHMEHIARELQIDSLELRRRGLLKKGDLSATGGRFHDDIKLEEIIASIEEISQYSQKRQQYSAGGLGLRGIGCSLFFHGAGFTGNGERDILKTRVTLRKNFDGQVEVLVSSSEIGQGVGTTLRKIAAKVLDIPLQQVVYNYPDTDVCPDSGPTIASRSILIAGKLIEDCALELKSCWDQPEVECSHDYQYPGHLAWDNERFQGDAYVDYAWGANVVEVEVDPLSGEIEVLGAWGVFDAGTPLDDRIVRGQIDGAMLQGLGYASMEVLQDEDGRFLQGGFTNYIIPTCADFPPIQSRLIENPGRIGPLGARGLGEIPLVGAAPALAMAVEQAIGKKIDRIPLTPEYIMELMYGG